MSPNLYRSQLGQDKKLNEEVFEGARGGVFCDVGAHDGETLSNTFFFERAKGWTGFAVEAHAGTFEALRANRDCVCVQGAALNRSGLVLFRENAGPSGSMLSGVEGTFCEEHRARIERETRDTGSRVVTVPCFELRELFAMHKVEQVDYLSVDTEGSECQVLEGVDFEAVKINCVGIEANYPGSFSHQRCSALLSAAGLRLHCRLEWDEVWVAKEPRWSWS